MYLFYQERASGFPRGDLFSASNNALFVSGKNLNQKARMILDFIQLIQSDDMDARLGHRFKSAFNVPDEAQHSENQRDTTFRYASTA